MEWTINLREGGHMPTASFDEIRWKQAKDHD